MKSYTNRHGRTVHYDDNGNKLGESYQSHSGRQVTHYDAEGRRIGRSYGDPDRRMVHYDNDGNRTGSSYTAYPGRIRHYDAAGSHTADTWNSCLGTTTRPAAGAQEKKPQPRQAQAEEVEGSTGCAALVLLAALVLFVLIGAALR